MVGGETDSSLREEIGVCPTMPLVRWQQGKSERDRPPKDAANLHWAINSRTDARSNKQAKPTQDRAPSGGVTYVAVSGGSRVRSPCFE